MRRAALATGIVGVALASSACRSGDLITPGAGHGSSAAARLATGPMFGARMYGALMHAHDPATAPIPVYRCYPGARGRHRGRFPGTASGAPTADNTIAGPELDDVRRLGWRDEGVVGHVASGAVVQPPTVPPVEPCPPSGDWPSEIPEPAAGVCW